MADDKGFYITVLAIVLIVAFTAFSPRLSGSSDNLAGLASMRGNFQTSEYGVIEGSNFKLSNGLEFEVKDVEGSISVVVGSKTFTLATGGKKQRLDKYTYVWSEDNKYDDPQLNIQSNSFVSAYNTFEVGSGGPLVASNGALAVSGTSGVINGGGSTALNLEDSSAVIVGSGGTPLLLEGCSCSDSAVVSVAPVELDTTSGSAVIDIPDGAGVSALDLEDPGAISASGVSVLDLDGVDTESFCNNVATLNVGGTSTGLNLGGEAAINAPKPTEFQMPVETITYVDITGELVTVPFELGDVTHYISVTSEKHLVQTAGTITVSKAGMQILSPGGEVVGGTVPTAGYELEVINGPNVVPSKTYAFTGKISLHPDNVLTVTKHGHIVVSTADSGVLLELSGQLQ